MTVYYEPHLSHPNDPQDAEDYVPHWGYINPNQFTNVEEVLIPGTDETMDYETAKQTAQRLADEFQMPVTLSTCTEDEWDNREFTIQPRAVEEALGMEI